MCWGREGDGGEVGARLMGLQEGREGQRRRWWRRRSAGGGDVGWAVSRRHGLLTAIPIQAYGCQRRRGFHVQCFLKECSACLVLLLRPTESHLPSHDALPVHGELASGTLALSEFTVAFVASQRRMLIMVTTAGTFGYAAAALRLLLLLLEAMGQSVVWQGRGQGLSYPFVGSGGRHEVQRSLGVHGCEASGSAACWRASESERRDAAG